MGELHDFIESSRSPIWVSKRVIARQRTVPTGPREATEEKQAEGFPDPSIELPNHQNELAQLSQFTKPSLLDKHLVARSSI